MTKLRNIDAVLRLFREHGYSIIEWRRTGGGHWQVRVERAGELTTFVIALTYAMHNERNLEADLRRGWQRRRVS